ITLFTNFHGILGMAEWARYLTSTWREIALSVWRPLLNWSGLKVDAHLASLLTLITFVLSISIGVRVRTGQKPDLENTLGALWPSLKTLASAFRRFFWRSQPAYVQFLLVLCCIYVTPIVVAGMVAPLFLDYPTSVDFSENPEVLVALAIFYGPAIVLL